MRIGIVLLTAIACLAVVILYDFAYNALYLYGVLKVPIHTEWLNLLAASGVPFLLQLGIIFGGNRLHLMDANGKIVSVLLAIAAAIVSWFNIMMIACEPFAC